MCSEGLVGENKLWKMERTLYGRRPAAKAWTQWIAEDLVARCGMERCDAIPMFFRKPGTKLALEVHMEDGHGCAAWEESVAFRNLLSENVALQ